MRERERKRERKRERERERERKKRWTEIIRGRNEEMKEGKNK